MQQQQQQQSSHAPFVMDNVGVQPVTVPNPSYSGQAVRPPVSSAAYPGAAASTGATVSFARLLEIFVLLLSNALPRNCCKKKKLCWLQYLHL